MSTKVVDVSQFNTVTSWPTVAQSVGAAIIRAGYRGYGSAGTLVTDTKFTANMTQAIAAGLPVGVYFVTQAITEAEAVAEADYVANLCKPYKITYPIYWDTENGNNGNGRADSNRLSKAMRTKCAVAFCERIKSLGYTPGIYASQSWLAEQMEYTSVSSYSIWVAKYAKTAPTLKTYDAWQYTDSGTVTGITGKVDLSTWSKSYTPVTVTANTTAEGKTLMTFYNIAWKNGFIGEVLLDKIDHIAYIPMNGTKGEALTAAAKRAQWNGRYPDIICNAELFNMSTYKPASAVVSNGQVHLLSESYGFGFKNNKTPVFSYKNNVNAIDYIGAYPVLVNNGQKAFTTTPAGLTGCRARTALAISDNKFVVIGVPANPGCTLDELAEKLISRGYKYAINLDGGGSTGYATKYALYDQGRAVRGFIGVWYDGGEGNKAIAKTATTNTTATSSMLQNAKYKSGVKLYANVNSSTWLNLRKYASTDSKVLAKLTRGTSFMWYGYYTSDNKWLYVKAEDGTCGYVSSEYTSSTQPT
jgi:GH25 family lysozyme M1 (1,4-beta-N-acetylmuramidase)